MEPDADPGRDQPPADRAPLLEALLTVGEASIWRGCVPGHKGGEGTDPVLLDLFGRSVFTVDLPHDMTGIDARTDGPSPYLQARHLLAAAYSARRAWFLTQGATQGVLATALAIAGHARRVLLQRSSHISLFSALALTGQEARFLPDTIDPVHGMPLPLTPAVLADGLARHDGIGAVFVTSPTYHGSVADVAGLAEVAHRAGALLVVDCSWGPHFGLHPHLPPIPTTLGADVCIISPHKHLGSLSQSAALLTAVGGFLPDEDLDESLALISSTSASQVLAASVDAARRRAVVDADELVARSLRARHELVAALDGTPFTVLGGDPSTSADVDPLRVVIDVGAGGQNGDDLSDLLELEHGIICEFCSRRLIGFVLGLGESADALRPLISVLRSLPTGPALEPEVAFVDTPALVCTVRQARFGPRRLVSWADAVGEVSGETIAIFPPGVATLIAGETVTAGHRNAVLSAASQKRSFAGAADPAALGLRVVDRSGIGGPMIAPR